MALLWATLLFVEYHETKLFQNNKKTLHNLYQNYENETFAISLNDKGRDFF